MPTVNIPEETFQHLARRAAALNVTVEELLRPALEQLTGGGQGAAGPQAQAAGASPTPFASREEWIRAVREWAASHAPEGTDADWGRESIYEGRGE